MLKARFKKLIYSALLLTGGSFFAHSSFDGELLWDLGAGPVRVTCSNADQIVPPLFECKVLDILKHEAFLRTSPLNSRSLLDLPLFQAPFTIKNESDLTLSLFYNKTDRSYFTKKSSNICSYIALESDPLLTSIETAFKTIKSSECGDFFIDTLGIPKSIFNTDVRRLFSLFSSITVEERRAGAMFDFKVNKGMFDFCIKFPFYWLERNFFLDQSELDTLSQEGLFEEQSPDQTMEYASDHIISDKIGFGDLRLMAGIQLFDKNDCLMRLGLQATLPTSLAIQKGIIGSEFKRCLVEPQFDICDLLSLGLNPSSLSRQLRQEFEKLTNQFIDRLSAILNDNSLGNGGHIGLGIYIEPTVFFTEYLSWRTRASFEWLSSAREPRFFIPKFDEAAFDAHNFASTDDVVAEENLRFINRRALDMLFPHLCGITVIPAPIITVSNFLTYTHPIFGFMLGFDFWYQGREKFSLSYHNTSLDNYVIAKAQLPSAYQAKLMAGFRFPVAYKSTDWILSLNGDTTVVSSGIGKDYTATLALTAHW